VFGDDDLRRQLLQHRGGGSGRGKAVDFQLSAEEIEHLSATTAPPALYTQWMIERQNEGR
jgi:hypothetical protein